MNTSIQEVGWNNKKFVTACTLGFVSIIVLISLAYLPVVFAWMNGDEVIDQTDRRQLTVEMNWFTNLAPGIYIPLLKWHAEKFGWECKTVYNLGSSHCIVIFNSNDRLK